MNNKIIRHFSDFFLEIVQVFFTPVFVTLTIVGNTIIGLAGSLFYYLEKDVNLDLEVIDAIWWSFATATTTGYGDITPKTAAGKLLGISLMLIGTALFATFTGLFAESILNSEKLRGKRDN